jgi:Ni,Fe-hydrogenase I large subunit
VLRDPLAVAASRDGIERQVLGMPAAPWLAQWQADPEAFVTRWAEAGSTASARWLWAARPHTLPWRRLPRPLAVQARFTDLQTLARRLSSDGSFALAPTWLGHPAETGPWTRLADTLVDRRPGLASAFMRLASRLAEVARLVVPEGEHWLAQGAVTLAPGEGLAWCEMARGLLIHWVRLAPSAAGWSDPRVDDCRVLAPTEWNFHPRGVVARLLAEMPADAPLQKVQLLAAAFDPCVALQVRRVDGRAGTDQEAACTR